MPLSLLLLLTGCGSCPTVDRVPPAGLLQDTPAQSWDGVTNEDMLIWCEAQAMALDACNMDKRLLKEWADETAK